MLTDYDHILSTALTRLGQCNEVVVDVETSGLDTKRNHIVGYSLCFGPAPSDTCYLPVRHAPGGNFTDITPPQTADGWDGSMPPWERVLLKALERPSLRIIGHNLAYDLKMLWRGGYTDQCAQYEDTQLNATLLNEWQGRFSLDFCANVAGVQAKKKSQIVEHILNTVPGANEEDAMGHYWQLRGDDPMAVEYAEGDGTTTWQLVEWQRPRLTKDELDRVHAVECQLIPVLVRQSMIGIRIDEERLHNLRVKMETKIKELMVEFPPDFNPKGPKSVRAYLESEGQTDWPLTEKKKQPSFPESWLKTHAPGQKIVKIRKMQTLLSSFIMPMIETHLFNGRVHATFNQLRNDDFGTVTGRLSSSDPNMTQIPHHSDPSLGRMFREIFRPDLEMTWGSCDYRQCEPRLLAHYSRCKVLLDDYINNPNADAHQAVADATGLDRQTGKRANQSLLTGGGAGVLVVKFGLSVQAAQDVFNAYFERLPEIRVLQKESTSIMKRRRYIKTLLGRRCRLLDPNKAYVALNRLLQGGNADVTKLKLVQIDQYLRSEGRPVDMLLAIHDSIDFQFRMESRQAYDECKRIMTDFGPDQPIHLAVPMPIDEGLGQDWGEATYGK
jgi:DNA polymerase I